MFLLHCIQRNEDFIYKVQVSFTAHCNELKTRRGRGEKTIEWAKININCHLTKGEKNDVTKGSVRVSNILSRERQRKNNGS
jgi:hypothetical protein